MTMGILLRSVAAVVDIFLDAGCGEKLNEDAERMDGATNSNQVNAFMMKLSTSIRADKTIYQSKLVLYCYTACVLIIWLNNGAFC